MNLLISVLILLMMGSGDDGVAIPAPLHSSEARVLGVAPYIDSETLWLARCIYSETDRTDEMRYVAWVVRNRVETRYRGRKTYRDVVLDPYQFSAFNARSLRRHWYMNLTPDRSPDLFADAVSIAYEVRFADRRESPLPKSVRHFYSPVSMRRNRVPMWVSDGEYLAAADIDDNRFRFYSEVR